MPKKYKEGIYMGVAPTTHMHATNVSLNSGESVQADSDAIHDYLNRKYELIETITLTEDTAVIERTTEPDTTPYNFEKLILSITTPAVTANRNVYFYINDINYLRMPIIRTSLIYSRIDIEIKNGILTNSAVYGTSITVGSNLYSNTMIRDVNNITKLEINCSDLIPADSVIEIYAVRAQEV